MLRELFLPLMPYLSALNVFRYITFRSSYSALTAMFICIVLGPLFISLLKHNGIGQPIRSDIPVGHQKKVGTPTMGGVIIIGSVLIASFLWIDIRNRYVWICLISLVSFGLVGFVDDLLKQKQKGSEGLRARFKLISQFIISLVIVLLIWSNFHDSLSSLRVPFFKDFEWNIGWWYIPFATLLLVGSTNAVNLTDGLDGLAIGLVLMVSLAYSVFAYLSGRIDFAQYLGIPYLEGVGELTIISFAISGASAGFLWFNSHPAKIMMGDTGSMALGGVIGTLAILTRKEILLVICGGVFVTEVLSVIIQVISYKLFKKRVFIMSPLHHHFELKGWSETQVVQRFWILGGVFAIISLSTLKIQ